MDNSKHRVVVNKSTVPVGCGNLVETLVREGATDAHAELAAELRFGVASNPEFLREGSAIHDSLYPDRIVVGAEDKGNGTGDERALRSAGGTEVPGAEVCAAANRHASAEDCRDYADQRGDD